MTYNSEAQDESKKALSEYKPMFSQTSYAVKGTELIMNSENGKSELAAQGDPNQKTQTEIMLKNTKGGGGGIFGGENPEDRDIRGSGSGNIPTAKEVEVTATLDYYDQMRLWFHETFGYKIKSERDIFDTIRDWSLGIFLTALTAQLVGIAMLFRGKLKIGIILTIIALPVLVFIRPTQTIERQ